MITNIRSLLQEQNCRLTQERAVLLDLFSHANKARTPIQLHQATLNAGVGIGLTTVYRMLEVLTKIGLASPFLLDGGCITPVAHTRIIIILSVLNATGWMTFMIVHRN